jgi:glycerol kinase
MQFQADLLGVPVVRPAVTETTALGAAYLAGLAVGYWKTPAEIESQRQIERRFEPQMDGARAKELRANWDRAVERSRGWAKAE